MRTIFFLCLFAVVLFGCGDMNPYNDGACEYYDGDQIKCTNVTNGGDCNELGGKFWDGYEC